MNARPDTRVTAAKVEPGRRLWRDLQILAAAVATLVALLVVANLTAAFVITRHVDNAISLSRSHGLYAAAIDDAALNAKGIANDERGFLLSGNETFAAEIEMRTLLAREAFADAARVADDDQYLAVTEAYNGFEAWLTEVNAGMDAYRSGARAAATSDALGPTRELRKNNEEALARAQSLAKRSLESASDSVSSYWSSSVLILLGYLGVALAMGLGITVWTLRTILPTVRELSRAHR